MTDDSGRRGLIADAEGGVTRYGYDYFGRRFATVYTNHVRGNRPVTLVVDGDSGRSSINHKPDDRTEQPVAWTVELEQSPTDCLSMSGNKMVIVKGLVVSCVSMKKFNSYKLEELTL